jgi:UDP-glucose 4-epimerase
MKSYWENIRGKNVVVTGGLGFVGHNLVKALVDEHDCKVTVVDNCLNSSEAVLGHHLNKVTLLKTDALDIDSYRAALDASHYIFHLACVQIAASSSNVEYDLSVNALSTLRLLEYLKHSMPAQFVRFVYTSSTSIYGSSMRLPLHEDTYPHVLSNYAATKLLGENFTTIYGKNYEVPVSNVRYSNVYGYGQSPTNPYCGVLGKFVHNALTGKPLPVIGDGEQTRDYTFITDAVRATILAAVHPQALNDVFNVGTGVETSVNQLANLIEATVPGVTIERLPERDIDNIRRRVCDIEKIHQRLGWTPLITIKRGIEQTVDWYRKFLEGQGFN